MVLVLKSDDLNFECKSLFATRAENIIKFDSLIEDSLIYNLKFFSKLVLSVQNEIKHTFIRKAWLYSTKF